MSLVGTIHELSLRCITKSMSIDQKRFKELREESRQREVPIVYDEVGEFLRDQVLESRAKKVLEVGTAVGVSAIWMGEALEKTNGFLKTIEKSTENAAEAKKNFANFDLQDRIEILVGDALKILESIDERFDLIFIDAAKTEYIDYFRQAKRLLAVGGQIIVDNVLMPQREEFRVKQPDKRHQKAIKAIEKFVKYVGDDEDVESEILKIGDGVMVIQIK